MQELLGGKFGEMSTLMNYTFQSFNFRGRDEMRPFYDLIANIAAEEYGHIELVSHTINMLLNGATKRGTDPTATPLETATDARKPTTSLPVARRRSRRLHGNPWNGTYVFSSGNLKLDLLHNFFLECGARANKIRVYEMIDDPVARAMVGYLLVRGGAHIVAYAKALEVLTGVDVGKLFPIPDISNKSSQKRRSTKRRASTGDVPPSPDDYREMSAIGAGRIRKTARNCAWSTAPLQADRSDAPGGTAADVAHWS